MSHLGCLELFPESFPGLGEGICLSPVHILREPGRCFPQENLQVQRVCLSETKLSGKWGVYGLETAIGEGWSVRQGVNAGAVGVHSWPGEEPSAQFLPCPIPRKTISGTKQTGQSYPDWAGSVFMGQALFCVYSFSTNLGTGHSLGTAVIQLNPPRQERIPPSVSSITSGLL